MGDEQDVWEVLESEDGDSNNSSSSRLVPINEEDDQLRRAIALSKAEASVPKHSKREETPEEERRMLAEAMEASLANVDSSLVSGTSSKKRKLSKGEPSSVVVEEAPAILRVGGEIFNRAQLEKERLKRQADRSKAMNGELGTVYQDKMAVTKLLQANASGPSSNQLRAHTSIPRTNPNDDNSKLPILHPFQREGQFPRDAAGEYYLDGEMRHTANKLVPASADPVFTPQQVIGKHSEISLIILSSFCIDDQWIEAANILPNPGIVPTVVIRPPPRDQRNLYNGKVESIRNGEVWCYPFMKDNWGTMHMKFFWIFYKTGRLRVCVLTANMVAYDWDSIENTVFTQDFLPLPSPVRELQDNVSEHDLPLQFRSLFALIRVGAALRHLSNSHARGSTLPFTGNNNFEDLKSYDWSRVKFRTLISISDQLKGVESISKYGMGRLGQILKDVGWKPKDDERVSLEYQGSSLGQYSQNWLNDFYSFASGKTLHSLVGASKPKTWPPVKVLFPSLKTVDNSVLKRDGGGTMFVGKGWNNNTKHLFYDSSSKRGGILMHSKIIVAIFDPENQSLGSSSESTSLGKRKLLVSENDDNQVGGWIYMGSHNFSPAAWGTLDLKKSPPSVHIRNFELGIVFPLDRKNVRAAADKIVPYVRPPRKYTAEDEPWNQNIHSE
ncbi:uncharacterized protein L203_100203 [Cryptococcus depauperatus CBS 7841]|uniref:Uncharacterized protein n=1 Tax=Cryptococcus depauperatus CBS 7841 TaxID=1295531 RepID=A0A1E3IZE9_9TREE|nr:hypothetical protein L203_00137 [Cryptococcus depauperatus CBS 7841]